MTLNGGTYDTFPSYPVQEECLAQGYEELGLRIQASGTRFWTIDGMSGLDWETLISGLTTVLVNMKIAVFDITEARKPPQDVSLLLADYLDNQDAVFAKLYPGDLVDFFKKDALQQIHEEIKRSAEGVDLVICFGQGSALLDLEGGLIWVDLPKEIITNFALGKERELLGAPPYAPVKSMYWVDWPVMRRHKAALLPKMDLFLDVTDPHLPVLIEGERLRVELAALARRPFRVKPVFYPGAWGGQWMKQHMDLDHSKPNYAWSYELITPENGVIFRDGDLHLEVPFEMLMAQEALQIQGPHVMPLFGDHFPIRFNYDDTIEGGNLSCQVHPQKAYMTREFGPTYAQDETYYILRPGEGGLCYLGLKEGIQSDVFRGKAERARDEGVAFDIEEFVNAWPTRVHDIYLIPAGTVHCSGANNVVLEMSATLYLYTFKIYDYLRRDLKGNFRPIHIERAWDNIDFTRTTKWVRRNLIPSPEILRAGEGWTEYRICDHPLMFFGINRVEFSQVYADDTERERFHVINLVEGARALVEWEGGSHPLHYAETMVIPAATGAYRVRNESEGICKIVKAFVK